MQRVDPMTDADIGAGTTVDDGAVVGVAYADDSSPPRIGPDGTIRRGTVIYDDVVTGSGLETGHFALIREDTRLGDHVTVGSQVVIDGACDIGDRISMQTGVYIPRFTEIGDDIFLGPNATLLNDMYPVRADYNLTGPTIENNVSIGANSTVLPAVNLGEGAFVAAGSVVTKDVPAWTLAIGNPANHRNLPEILQADNAL